MPKARKDFKRDFVTPKRIATWIGMAILLIVLLVYYLFYLPGF
jgi:cytochrome oxidase assembly protein ShyY1